jgi:DNA-directed RNA polymerase specialized sigma24 family protein
VEAVDDPLWQLFRTVASEGAGAWPALAAALDEVIVAMARQQPLGRLRAHDDTPREIVARVLSRLHRNNFEAIRKIAGLTPRPDVKAFLFVLVRRSAIDYLRASPEFARGNAERAHAWISLATLASNALAAPDTLGEKRAEVLAFMTKAVAQTSEHVRDFGADEAIATLAALWKIDRTHVRRLIQRAERYGRVLTAVFEGHTYPEIAERLGLSPREVELTVRYIEDFLAARGFGNPLH